MFTWLCTAAVRLASLALAAVNSSSRVMVASTVKVDVNDFVQILSDCDQQGSSPKVCQPSKLCLNEE